MKNISYLFIVFAFLLFVACDNDDDGGNSIVGTWILQSQSYENCTDPANNGTETFNGCTAVACGKLTFNSDGSAVIRITIPLFGIDETVNATWEDKGNNQIELCEGSSCDTVNYNVSGNNLTTSFVDEDGCDASEVYRRE
jgi:hypothetical protein